MRIAFIGQKGIPALTGGVERRVEELSTRMAKMGHEVFVYARKGYASGEANEYKGVHVIYLSSIRNKNLETIIHTFFATIHALFQNYDVVHYQAPGPSTLSWIIRIFKPKTTLVATFNSRDCFHQKWGWFARNYLRFGEYVICKIPQKTFTVSRILRKYIKDRYGREAVFIPNGAAVEFDADTREIKKWNLDSKKYLLLVSRFIPHKGIHYAIEAFKKLEDTSKVPNNFKLVIAGDGAYTDNYVLYLKSLAWGRKNIIFVGNQSGKTLAQLFSNAYLFIQPSEAEGLSIAILEAMGVGVAPLVSDIDENLEAIQGQGFTFENKNVGDLEKKLAYLLNSPAEVAGMSQASRQYAEKEYSWDSIVEKTLKVYEELIIEKNAKLSFGKFKK